MLVAKIASVPAFYNQVSVSKPNNVRSLNGNSKTVQLLNSNFYSSQISQISFGSNSAEIENKVKELEERRPFLANHAAISISDWVDQFDTDKDKKTALKILDKFLYINIDQARRDFKEVYNDISSREGFDLDKTTFSCLGTGKSGGLMTYLFKQANGFRSKGRMQHENLIENRQTEKSKKEYFMDYSQLSDKKYINHLAKQGKDTLVILDDIIGEGDSLIEFATPELVDNLKKFKKIYYTTLVSEDVGVKRFKEKFPDLNIEFISANKVSKYTDEKNTDYTQAEKEEISRWVLKYGNKIDPASVRKFDMSRLFVTFDWNTPGNTPMPFCLSVGDKWDALFPRYNGLIEHKPSRAALSE